MLVTLVSLVMLGVLALCHLADAGTHLVESFIWLMLVTILAMLDIEKPLDSDGKGIEPDVKFENSVFRSGSLYSKIEIGADR